jgi:thioredoxin reductase
LTDENEVTLSYRSDSFGRIKPKNNEKIREAIANKSVNMLFNSNITSIEDHQVKLFMSDIKEEVVLENDLVYIFAGGELPTQFLEKIGIRITKKFGEPILKHEK